MKEKLEEMLAVYLYSTRTQWAVYCGFGFFFVTLVVGKFHVAEMYSSGACAKMLLGSFICEWAAANYEQTAFTILFMFLVAAWKTYAMDRKRLMRL